MADGISTHDVIAFRLDAHHLAKRLGENSLLDAAGRCGIQNSPPGSTLLALNARVEGVTRERLDAAVTEDKTLLQTWCLRGSPFHFPAADAAVFTAGVLPPTEEAMRHFMPGVQQAVDRLDMRVGEVVDLVGAEITEVLSGRRLDVGELGSQVARRIAGRLPDRLRATWDEEGPYAAGQSLGEGVVHFCLRILALRGVVCLAPRAGNKAPFVLVREWLGHGLPDSDPEPARAELLRRFLRCYGPSTRAQFAAWVGIGVGDTDAWWSLIEPELTRVEFRGTSWLLTRDLPALQSPPDPTGLRLLPPHDPYLQLRDRETIVGKEHHRDVWKTVGDPGAILVDGRIAGIWRPRKAGSKLTFTIRLFTELRAREETALREEAERVAALRGAAATAIVR